MTMRVVAGRLPDSVSRRAAMRIAIAIVVLSVLAMSAGAATRTRGYATKRGTYVAPHYSSSPNRTKLDNYSSKGNYNPYTGKAGARDPYAPPKPRP